MTQTKKKILLVSDYVTVFSGGIEMYMSNVAKLIGRDGFQAQYFGITRSAQLLKKARSYLLPLTGFNIISALGLIIRCYKRKPDVIRFHSLVRYHGRLPVRISGFVFAQKMMMYHDLGYFHPFPHLVTQEDQVLSFGLVNFVRMGMTAKKPQTNLSAAMVITAVVLKYCSLYLLRLSLIGVVDKHLVP
ncbi:MAG: hypothetical protein WC004_01820, partial [Candidatus Absconditabacterales bacterium]